MDDFYITYNPEKPTRGQKIIWNLLINYPETKWFIDAKIDSVEDLDVLKRSNPILAHKADYFVPKPTKSLKDSFFVSIENNNTCIAFCQKEENWFNEGEDKGGLCFSSNTMEDRISTIIENFHYKIDLSEERFSLDQIKFLRNTNYIIVNDNYILSDKDNQKIDKNLSPLLKNLILESTGKIKLQIFSKNFNPLSPGTPIQIRDAVLKRSKKLHKVFANFNIEFKIINNTVSRTANLSYHDRVILTNFQAIDCGAGFNLIPHKPSNSQIISETIFELYTYKRIKNLRKKHQEYFLKISSENFQTSEFTYM